MSTKRQGVDRPGRVRTIMRGEGFWLNLTKIPPTQRRSPFSLNQGGLLWKRRTRDAIQANGSVCFRSLDHVYKYLEIKIDVYLVLLHSV